MHGEQEEAAYNGHFGCMCYHPLFCFNQFGDCEGAVRPGNVHSGVHQSHRRAYLKLAVRLLFRADLPRRFTSTWRQGFGYAIRLSGERLTCWYGLRVALSNPSSRITTSLAQSGTKSSGQGGVAQGDLFPRVGFIVTNLSYPEGTSQPTREARRAVD